MVEFDPVGTVCFHPMPGTETVQAALIKYLRVHNLGTFGCRTIRGSSTLSFHGEGRAGDLGGTHEQLRACADLLVACAEQLGVQEVIFDGHIWRSTYATWRVFTGADAHRTHVHYALNWAGARSENAFEIDETIGAAMPLNDEDLKKISAIVEAQILAHLGYLGENDAGEKRKTTIVNAVVRGIESTIKPDHLR